MKKALVLGAGGFIGSHLVKRLQEENYWVHGVDLKKPEFENSAADRFTVGDLREHNICDFVIESDINEIYQLAADMGGAGYVFVGENDADIIHNSALINLNVAHLASKKTKAKVFYSSSACIYPERNQLDKDNPICSEDSAYPAAPDSEYGWEKLISERVYLSHHKNKKLDITIARFHNIFGPYGTWTGGKEKAPAAICRKVAEKKSGESIDIWGDGEQTRSFLYIDECVEAVMKMMNSQFKGPLNIGSEELISINDMAKMIIDISGKKMTINHIPGPQGVRGRCSDNRLIRQELGWAPSQPLKKGLERTYAWIAQEVSRQKKK